MNKIKPGHAVCCFCLQTYFVGDGELCTTCGDICCGHCISDLQECPDCDGNHEEGDGESGEFTWYEMDGTEGPKVGT